jgi:hypothetical protein
MLLDPTFLGDINASADLAKDLGERFQRLRGFPMRENNGVSRFVGIEKGFRGEGEVGFAKGGKPLHGLWVPLFEPAKVECEILTA